MTEAMFPLIFQSLCAHKISSVQHFTWTRLNLELRVWNNVQKTFLERIFMCAPSFLMCARRMTHARAHTLTAYSGQKWRRRIRVAAVLFLCCFSVASFQVSSTDTLPSIAAQFETTTSELKKLNRLMSEMVFPGKVYTSQCERTHLLELRVYTPSLCNYYGW